MSLKEELKAGDQIIATKDAEIQALKRVLRWYRIGTALALLLTLLT